MNNNLPGVPGFCPLVRRTERLSSQKLVQLGVDTRQMLAEAEPVMLRRAAVYMLLNESKGSFGIEGEAPPQTRLERWGHLITTAGSVRLSIPGLETLQRSLFDKGQRFVRNGLRQTGGFVGQRHPYENAPLPDQISARPEDLRVQNGGTVSARKRAEFFPGAPDDEMAELEAAVRASGIVPDKPPAP